MDDLQNWLQVLQQFFFDYIKLDLTHSYSSQLSMTSQKFGNEFAANEQSFYVFGLNFLRKNFCIHQNRPFF